MKYVYLAKVALINLNWKPKTARSGKWLPPYVDINRDARQVCMLSPHLFTACTENFQPDRKENQALHC